ncbi:hypothetical protein RchiOBHm_Chr6g0245561 [Rosa chinensis]|uniref:Transmembrane protein n=1 Tax=Rosa chinensis TaxID=74649 RepID=A0A2P6PJ98_ROSCH|nr:hypothetical protein RchiOBHm_Chr6g0245561 [Rosa chinensis]
MGHHCYRTEAPSSYPVLVFLAVTVVLLLLSTLISSFEVEAPKFEINFGLIAAPLLLLAVVHSLSSM